MAEKNEFEGLTLPPQAKVDTDTPHARQRQSQRKELIGKAAYEQEQARAEPKGDARYAEDDMMVGGNLEEARKNYENAPKEVAEALRKSPRRTAPARKTAPRKTASRKTTARKKTARKTKTKVEANAAETSNADASEKAAASSTRDE